MGNVKSIEKDTKMYCDKTGKKVNIHSLIHSQLNRTYSEICDETITCNIKNCKYKGEKTNETISL